MHVNNKSGVISENAKLKTAGAAENNITLLIDSDIENL